MIILNLENVKSEEEKIEKYENMINIPNCICPKCGGSDFIYYGSYERNVIYIGVNEEKEEKRLKIKRIQCQSCGITHAVIPDFLVPYKQHTVELISEVLDTKISECSNDKEIEEKYGVTRQLLKKWIKDFQKCEAKLSTLYSSNNRKIIIRSVREEVNIILKFYYQFREIYLMMRKKAIYEYAPT